jgi:hypothetical protein
MKNVVLLISFCVSALNLFSQQPVVSISPKVKFVSEVIDLGTVNQDGDGSREFKLTNVGKEPLILQSVNSSASSLVASWPKEPVEPGKSAVIKAQYDTKRVGKFEKTLTVQTNDPERPSIVLKIKGEVVAPK